jgi:hypothetical protein
VEAVIQRASADSRRRRVPEVDGLTDYCSRPSCRKEFRRTVGPGRRQAFCSEFCRRTAQNELRRTRSCLTHYEGIVRKLRIDVAAFGRPDTADDDDEEETGEEALTLEARHQAESAVHRADGILKFADPSDPVVQELRALYEAVLPMVRLEMMTG